VIKLITPPEACEPLECALRPSNHLDSAIVVIGEIGEIECAGEPLIEGNSVQQNLGWSLRAAADENGSQLAWNSGLHDIDTGYRLERVGDQNRYLMLVDIRIRYDADRGGGAIFRSKRGE